MSASSYKFNERGIDSFIYCFASPTADLFVAGMDVAAVRGDYLSGRNLGSVGLVHGLVKSFF